MQRLCASSVWLTQTEITVTGLWFDEGCGKSLLPSLGVQTRATRPESFDND